MAPEIHHLPFGNLSAIQRGQDIVNYPIVSRNWVRKTSSQASLGYRRGLSFRGIHTTPRNK